MALFLGKLRKTKSQSQLTAMLPTRGVGEEQLDGAAIFFCLERQGS